MFELNRGHMTLTSIRPFMLDVSREFELNHGHMTSTSIRTLMLDVSREVVLNRGHMTSHDTVMTSQDSLYFGLFSAAICLHVK